MSFLCAFIRFIHPLTHSPTHSLTHPPTRSFTHPPTLSLTHSLAHPLPHSPTHSLSHSLTHPLTHLTHSPSHSLTHSFTHPPTLSLTHSSSHSLTHSPHSLIHPLTHSFTHPPTHSLTHSLTLSLTHPLTSLTHPLTHSFTHSPTNSLILSLSQTEARHYSYPSTYRLGWKHTGTTFVVHLRRKRTFYILNTIIPVVMLSLLNVLVFILPADCGERMALAVTVLLSFTVYLGIISDSMPKTSESLSLLGGLFESLLPLSRACPCWVGCLRACRRWFEHVLAG